MFFETMGDESTLVSSLIDNTEISQAEDPLMRFHPELSMDGLSQHGQEEKSRQISGDNECEIGQVGGTQTLKTAGPANKLGKGTKSMNVLTSVNVNHKIEATDRNFEVCFYSKSTLYCDEIRYNDNSQDY